LCQNEGGQEYEKGRYGQSYGYLFSLSVYWDLQGEHSAFEAGGGYDADEKPLLLLALEEYFTSPSDDVLRRLFDTCNSIPIDGMPTLSRNEKILLRSSERKDLLVEKYQDELSRLYAATGGDEGRRTRQSSSSSAMPSVFEMDKQRKDSLQDPSERSLPRDTHWFETKVEFRGIKVPIRIPMTTFAEDVGEVRAHAYYME
jgi:hypothetical protein